MNDKHVIPVDVGRIRYFDSSNTQLVVAKIPRGYVRGFPLPIYEGTTSPAPKIRTQIAPET